ncbi:MAG: hypothetical protein HY735_15100, partial [Verrucomicrobia bacterium]|nr:hypothetical protein [Verrucomicrobiota bacterium]
LVACATLAFGCLGFCAASFGQALPVDIQQDATHYNLQKTNGVPLSNTVGTPDGSDGRAPSPGSGSVGTVNQFQSVVLFASSVRPISANLDTTKSYAANAENLDLPRATANANAVILLSARVGAPFLSRSLSFLFGAVVPPPDTDEFGVLLSVANTDVTPNRAVAAPSDYWLAEPFTSNNHQGAGYYWSPHARQVFAINPGPLAIAWRKAVPSVPPGSLPVNVSTSLVNGIAYTIYTNRSVVSGSAVKSSRKMYWTEGVFRAAGKPVTVPPARVGAVNIVYNNSFPEKVTAEYQALGQVPITATTNTLQELRTLWYDQQQGQIYAYNKEGRVFLELLGDEREDRQTRVHLGFEIVDVVRQPNPSDVTVHLGEPLTAYPDGSPNDSDLFPDPVLQIGRSFTYRHTISGTDRPVYYATRETRNINDLPVHWLETGLQGLRWPFLFVRYRLGWPSDVAKYSHYVRPQVATEEEARLTSVPLPPENAPVIDYQDPLDGPRAKLTERFEFYTFLEPSYPVHRTLLRFTSKENVAFERVFSWLNANLKSGNFTNTLATSLSAWNSTSNAFVFPPEFTSPRVLTATVNVGDRIPAPSGESGSGLDASYLAGHIRTEYGTSYNPTAYVDPFAAGFDAANKGAIIPVNAIPGKNQLEVWWFRKNTVNVAAGFKPTHWPSVIGTYTLQWPSNPSEIVLASNDGSGALLSLQAKGSIYFQNDLAQHGYNPNEEHALMQGGQAWALRDDLNITSGANYTSDPFVLLDYTESDGRPAVRVFKVLREKGNVRFNYQVEAGTVLQPPMPLPLMEKPLGPKIIGSEPRSLNHEVYFRTVASSTANGDLTTTEPHHFRPWFRELALQSPDLSSTKWFFATNTLYSGNLLQGVVSDSAARSLTTPTNQPSPIYNLAAPATTILIPNLSTNYSYLLTVTTAVRYNTTNQSGLSTDTAVYAIAPALGSAWLMKVLATDATAGTIDLGISTTTTLTSLNALLTASSSSVLTAQATLLQSLPSTNDLQAASLLFVPSGSVTANQFANWALRARPIPAGRPSSDSFALQDRKGNLWIYRGPHQAGDTPHMGMQFYYKTLPGFFFPKNNEGGVLNLSNQPAVGTITPYLRSLDSGGVFSGDPIFGSTTGLTDNNNALEVTYNPKWPELTPVLQMAETLTTPKRGLPAVRGQTSLQIVYQQSTVSDTNNITVRLHDATREKVFELGPRDGIAVLGKIPDSVKTESSRGKTWFPLLPPHLVQRFFFDPNRGANGALVFKGEYVQEALGESYVHLNVLSQKDTTTLENLCVNSDPAFNRWTAAIAALQTKMETFVENPQKPGTFLPAEGAPTIGPGAIAEVANDDVAVDSYALTAVGPGTGYVTLIAGDGLAFTPRPDPVSVLVIKVTDTLYPGEVKIILPPNPLHELLTLQQVVDLAGKTENYAFEWRIAAPVDGLPPTMVRTNNDPGAQWLPLAAAKFADGLRAIVGESADVQALTDNYLIMRYRAIGSGFSPGSTNWSAWTDPALAEGWIKRVLAGINPFNQRVTDLFNNSVSIDVSLLTQAGPRWEGDVALNADSINSAGLIEIYETVLGRGRMLSINSGINYGPANDALLLAAGYINDLYMLIGNEAWADAANPTIGIGTKDKTYGDIATALFSFKGQLPSLLEEELALLRGRDDFLLPGVELRPVYNRLIWNFTRGIDAGEVIYSLNYNILDEDRSGAVNAEDARRLFPQGHGDAYGHYLTALKGYYALLLNSNFDWVPRIEAVNVLGKAVSVDFLDERKFAAAAAAAARAGKQIFDLTWRKDYKSGQGNGWAHFTPTRVNTSRKVSSTRYWGMDHWASRVGEGTYLNWMVGNAILPDVDPDPSHEGIQKIDRKTVPELKELPAVVESLQTAMDNAEAGMTPLGLPETTVPFDINPAIVTGTNPTTHFEQIYDRAKTTLNNALAAFDDAKDVTRLLRSEADSLDDFRNQVNQQELAYTNLLIEIYGTPYTDDIGPGKLYKQGYAGPDFVHYSYVDLPETIFPELWSYTEQDNNLTLQINDVPTNWPSQVFADAGSFNQNITNITFNLGSHGFYDKPSNWTGQRASPGKVQQAISELIAAHTRLRQAVNDSIGARNDWVVSLHLLQAQFLTQAEIRGKQRDLLAAEQALDTVKFASSIVQDSLDLAKEFADKIASALAESLPQVLIAGLAAGSDFTAPARGAIKAADAAALSNISIAKFAVKQATDALEFATEAAKRWSEFDYIGSRELTMEQRQAVLDLANQLSNSQAHLWTINQALRKRDDAERNYRAILAEGDRIQQEREVFRQRAAAVIQGYRTRDAAFRIFRNEKLDRYKSLFDLAARYAFMSAQAFDYETGLLGKAQGREFISRIVQSRALGLMRNGEPQFAGSNTGDPGLSSAMAEMYGDWLVLKGRLGFNNPDAYGTTVSLRTENFRILPNVEGDANWRDVLNRGKMQNLLDDADVRRACLQIDPGNGLPVPGLVLDFSTVIANGLNLFGQSLASGDSAFNHSAFATKIFAVGVALEGYRGMNNPTANSSAVGAAGGTSPADPSFPFLDPLGLAATPNVYLVPVGVDSMRSPPLGDASTVRTWNVDDVTIPLPFNIGGSDFSTKQLWQSSDSLSEQLFGVRKHQAFRPVSSTSAFSQNIYFGSGLSFSQYTNRRLIGRSVWNSKWKLVVPGYTLLNNPNEGLDRFIQTVKDIKLHFVTYSYAGN